MPDDNPIHPIVAVKAARAEAREKRDAIVEKARAAGRADLLATEQREFNALTNQIDQSEARIAELEAQEVRLNRVAASALRIEGAGGSSARIGNEERTYRPDGESSYFGDLLRRQIYNDSGASQRLARHAAENDMERRDINRTDGSGGEFVPPLWLVEQYAEYARATRVFADRYTRMPLPTGTDSINVPRITTGTATAIQTTDNAAVQETDMVTATVTCPVRTIAGQQDVSLQLLEQSPIAFDQVIFRDLLADYNSVLDYQLIAGSGTSGQLQGVMGLSGVIVVSYTDASPTLPELYPKGGSAYSQIVTARKLPPEAWVMHPRRWAWELAQLDGSSRPYITQTDQGPTNAVVSSNGNVDPAEPVGTWYSLPVYVDGNVPATLTSGAGTSGTEDCIIGARFSDHHLYEGTPRTRILPEVLSGTLTVRLQLYNYVAATAGRFPAATAVISGTGLAAPTFS